MALALLLLSTVLIVGPELASAAPYSTKPTLSASDPCAGGGDLVIGNGFKPNETVTITLSGVSGIVGTVRTDSAGHFRVVVELPAALRGSQVLTASGSSTDQATTDISVHTCSTKPKPSASITLTPTGAVLGITSARSSSSSAAGSGTSTSPSTSVSAGGLPYTGIALVGLIVLALALIGTGMFLLGAGRRKRTHW